MNDKYVSLSKDFSMKRSVSTSVLYCLRNGVTYDLTPDQESFLDFLDGTITFSNLVNKYSKSSRSRVHQMLEQMTNISAVTFTDEPNPRLIGKNKVPDVRLESVHLEASGECNMRCVHCYQAKYVKSGESLNFSEITKLLNDLESMQVSRVGISGGEPLLMPYLPNLLKSIEDREMKISAIFSNGLLVDKKLVRMIKNLRSSFSLFISLDSLPGRTLSFRGVSSKNSRKMQERILESIRLLTRSGISVVVNTVVNTENLNHLNEMYETLGELKIASWRLGFPKMTPQFKQHSDKYNVEWRQIAEKCLSLLKRHLSSGMPFQIQIEYLFREELFKQGLLHLSDEDYVCDYEGRRTELCVKPNGDVVSCAYCTELPIGNIKQTNIRDIWYSQKVKRVKNIKIGQVAECDNCELKSLCGTGCRANAFFLHGDFENAKDDYACMAMAFFKENVLPLLKERKIIK